MNRCRSTFAILVACLVASVGAVAAAQGADALFARLEAAAADLPRTTFDPAAVVAEVGTEPDALFAWVRDRIGFVAYRGALKGAAGTLLDGGGNALDRALLLRALLAAAGHESALAHATLAPDVAERLAAVVRLRAPAAAAPAELAALGARADAELGVDGAALAAELDRLAAAAAARRTELEARAANATDALLALVGEGPAGDAATLLSDHWWVLLRAPDGTLVDLDPTLPEAVVGERLAEPSARVAPGAVAELAALEGSCRDLSCGDRLHVVRVGAIAEVIEDGALVEHVLLDHELLPADLLGAPLALMVASDGGDLAPFATVDPAAALRAALLEQGVWQPVLRVGEDEVQGRAVTAAGVVQDSLSGGSGGGPLGGFGGAFGGAFGGGGGRRRTASRPCGGPSRCGPRGWGWSWSGGPCSIAWDPPHGRPAARSTGRRRTRCGSPARWRSVARASWRCGPPHRATRSWRRAPSRACSPSARRGARCTRRGPRCPWKRSTSAWSPWRTCAPRSSGWPSSAAAAPRPRPACSWRPTTRGCAPTSAPIRVST